jgi:hypothetical protein
VAQIKVYGLGEHLNPVKPDLSDVIHSCVVDALSYPPEKRFHRFFPLAAEDFYYPEDRSARYTIIEIAMFEGRTVEAKKHLFRLLFERARDELGSSPAFSVNSPKKESPPSAAWRSPPARRESL